MAIALATEYPYAEAPSAEYPGGSFKNDSTGATGDGTPLEKQWANDFLGFFQALLSGAGVVASGAPDTAVNSQYLQALQSLMWSPGDTKWVMYTTPDPRWLEMDGRTIGDGSSNGTARANADTWGLFARLWPLAAVSILTSAGGATTRGASDAADFAAHKVLVIPDMRGRFPRGWSHGATLDPARAIASVQTDAIQNIVGTFHGDDYDLTAGFNTGAFAAGGGLGSGNDGGGGGGQITFDASRVVRTADETRPSNIAGMFVIRY